MYLGVSLSVHRSVVEQKRWAIYGWQDDARKQTNWRFNPPFYRSTLQNHNRMVVYSQVLTCLSMVNCIYIYFSVQMLEVNYTKTTFKPGILCLGGDTC